MSCTIEGSAKARVNSLLMDYLRNKTNYAIILNASWGAGKTHYIKHELFPKLHDIGYKGILISLFGATTIDEIKERIFLELYPLLNNKYVKAAGTVLKAALKSTEVLKLAGLDIPGLVSSLTDESSLNKEDFINFNKILICFDDLERITPNMLTSNQILGFVNSLVEHENVKVLIITNEGKIAEEAYQEIKEKTIGNIIQFRQSFDEVFENYVNTLNDDTRFFCSYLKENKSLICEFLLKENNDQINLRTFFYFISSYRPIFHFIQSGLKAQELKEKRKEIHLSILRFTLMVSIEYKKGEIGYRNTKGLDVGIDYMIRKLYPTNRPKTYVDETLDNYFPLNDFKFYGCIYDFITGGDIFDTEKLYGQLCTEYHVINETITEAYKIFNKLSSTSYQELSDSEYIQLTRQLRQFAKEGAFQLQDYLTVFYYIARQNDYILKLNLQKLTEDLKRAIIKLKKQHVYYPALEAHCRLDIENPLNQYYSQLFSSMKKVNDFALSQQNYQLDRILENKLKHNYDQAHSQLIADTNKPFTRATLSGISPTIAYRIFKTASNKKKKDMLMLIRILYSRPGINFEEQDFKFLKGLFSLILHNEEKSPLHNLSGCLILELKKLIQETINMRAAYFPSA